MDSGGGAEGAKAGKAWSPSDLTLGSIGPRSLQDIAGMEVSNVFGPFVPNLHRNLDLTDVFKTFFCASLLSCAAKIPGFLRKQRLGCLRRAGGRTREKLRSARLGMCR